jgi:hypothetical protein
MAVGRKILQSAYLMLSTNTDYRELGDAYLDKLDTERTALNLARRIERLGFDVRITPKASQAEANSSP